VIIITSFRDRPRTRRAIRKVLSGRRFVSGGYLRRDTANKRPGLGVSTETRAGCSGSGEREGDLRLPGFVARAGR
jgi:hypothetical protein